MKLRIKTYKNNILKSKFYQKKRLIKLYNMRNKYKLIKSRNMKMMIIINKKNIIYKIIKN